MPGTTVCWRIRSDDPNVASVRYRCLIPSRHLEALGVDSSISWGAHDPLQGSTPAAIVFVKTFERPDLELAERAVAAGIPVLLDVCDNVYAPDYRPPAAPDLETFERMAALAAAVVTTGPGLAQALRERLGDSLPLHVVPDPAETLQDARRAPRTLLRNRLSNLTGPGRAPVRPMLAPSLSRGLGLVRGLRRNRSGNPGERPQVIWFGNTGSTKPRYGIVNLLDVGDQLVRAASSTPFRLLVVSGDPVASRERLAAFPLDTEHVRWDRLSIFRHLRRSSVAVIPNSRDEFSVCKSANRAVLALSNGAAVVATDLPSLQPLSDCIALDDFEAGVRAYLEDPRLAATHLRRAGVAIDDEFSGHAVAHAWLRVLEPFRTRS